MRAPAQAEAAGGLIAEQLVVERGGRPVVAGVDLEIRPGQVTALLGANGAGKSSLVLALAGALPAASGKVIRDGTPIQNLPPNQVRRLGVAAIPEGHRVLGDLTIDENLRVAGTHLSRREMNKAVAEAYETFPELYQRRTTPAGALSGGQQQMVVIGQAIVCQPSYILADELSFGLAPVIVARLIPVLTGFAQRGAGVLLIEQFTHIALAISRHVYVMERGRIAFSGQPEELERNPAILHGAYLAQGRGARSFLPDSPS
jgi:branched-chain amino acid transport system ATP-binding protein